MNGYEIRDSKGILEYYDHPKEGQGVYVFLGEQGKLKWCPSGNNLKTFHEAAPEKYLTGPIFLPLSKEDHQRFLQEFHRQCDNF